MILVQAKSDEMSRSPTACFGFSPSAKFAVSSSSCRQPSIRKQRTTRSWTKLAAWLLPLLYSIESNCNMLFCISFQTLFLAFLFTESDVACFVPSSKASILVQPWRNQLVPSKGTSTSVLSAPAQSVSSITAAVPPKLQAVLVISSVMILTFYHINLFVKERLSKEKTWRAYQAETREDWARHVRNTEGWLYAVQTLRNAITAQTFLATTVLSLLTLITGKLWDILRTLSRGAEKRLLTVQLISVALTMLFSAYQFLQGVRLMTHAGFMFPVSEGTKVDNIMRRSQNCQWLGLRWMYLSLGPITWAVGGSRAFFVTSICLLQFFRKIDRKPSGLGYESFQGGGI